MTAERDKIEDKKLIFYLERRKQIDEWAKLAEVEKSAAHRFLRDLTPDLLKMSEVAGLGDVSIEHFVLNSEQLVGLWRPNWLRSADGVADAVPRVVVAIGWWKSVRFAVPEAGPYVGLRLASGQDRALRTEIGRLVHERGSGAKAFPAGNPLGTYVWVRYRHLSAATNVPYWEDLGPFRRDLVDAVRDAYSEFTAVVDDALRSSPTAVL